MVYVQNIDGQPLMPTERHGMVKHLLKENRARVVMRCPFTIRLKYKGTTYTQNLTQGDDTGSGTFAMAVARDNGDIVYASQVELRNDITEKMTRRCHYRRNRRSRKTRYRKARWLNRKNSRRPDRLSPTMKSKLDAHERENRLIRKILPVTKHVSEMGQFDMQLMKNPSLAENKWGYQKGPNYGFANTRAMVLNRDNYTCQCCKGKHKDPKLEIHHVVFRRDGGSDNAENLVTLCHTCHKKLHDGKISPDFKGMYKGNLKFASQMNVIRSQWLKMHPDIIETFGYITKENRQLLGLGKDHYIDACVIATGGKPFQMKTLLYKKKCVAKGDMRRSKGVRSETRIPKGKICGFKKFDKVLYLGNKYFIKGRYSTGYAVLMDFSGKKADFSYLPKGKIPKMANMRRIGARKSWIVTAEVVTPNSA